MTQFPWLSDIGGRFTGGTYETASGSAVALLAAQPPPGGFSLNVATGQNAAGVIQTKGDLPDANWTVTNADSYKNSPIAYVVAPGDADWYGGWMANGPNSSWIAANPESSANGNITYTFTFNLTGYDPADATLVGGKFMVDDAGTVYLNGHALASTGFNGWESGFTALPDCAGDFVAGVNTLVIRSSDSDNLFEAGRFEGTIVDPVSTSTPVHWAGAVSGDFSTAADWTGGVVPGAGDDAILDPAGAAFTVTSWADQTVNSIQTAANASLALAGGDFTATSGTGTGANAGDVSVGAGATLTAGGDIGNAGAVSLNGAVVSGENARAELLVAAGGATLSGGGSVVLGASALNIISGATASATLTNLDNTISGAGLVGDASMGLVNEAAGVIDGNADLALVVDTGANALVNAGLIEATGLGGLTIRDTTVDGSGGGVIAAGDGAILGLQGATLVGGTLETTGSGAIRTFKGPSSTLDGTTSAVDNKGDVVVLNGTALTLEGAIDNGGVIAMKGSGSATTLTIGGAGATLSGGGPVNLSNSAGNVITGTGPATVLTNVDNRISGAGDLGDGSLTLVNEVAGIIVGPFDSGLIIDTGANTIVNAGIILARGTSTVTLQSAVASSGQLEVDGGVLRANAAVTGPGRAAIYAGTLDFTSGFSQNVVFQQTSGMLELAQSQGYTGTIINFSKTGGTSLDLRDIGFVSSTEATFAGTFAGGVLTVTDGTHTAHIALRGNYLGSTFTASSDGQGGTIVVDPTSSAALHRFVAAAAGMRVLAGQAILFGQAPALCQIMLTSPRVMAA